MSASNSLTRGPLPPGVYWRRRIVVLVGAAVLVFAIAHLLGGGGDGSSGGDPAAQQAAAPITTSSGTTTTTTAPTTGVTSPTATTSSPASKGTGAAATSTSPLVLAAPSGRCNPGDITVAPRADHAVAGTDITITFALQTKKTPACTFEVTPRDLAVKIVRHGRVLWTSQQCRDALPERTVVVRNVVPSLVSMVWNGQVSTVGCRRDAGWVRPGDVTIWAATLGGEPGHGDATLAHPGESTATASPSESSSPRPKATPTSSGTPEPRR